ncbi:hypothetical protein [Escherichia coli]|uniref:hypothetical protein n=1 Tax=Escherichia coli TaxID=562 RepID=UPI0010C3DE3E|nr:hypothetical protein [Escherichia coli]GCT65342.1 hypothetical protein HmCmsJML001_02207 [Escherichia coli]
MQKREPVIIAPDYTDDELYEWMRQKINAAQDLKWSNEARAKQAAKLSGLEQDTNKPDKRGARTHATMVTEQVISATPKHTSG